jgi:uncharacterized protein
MVGIVTPFCSCSAVPLFIGFLEAGVPLGVTFSYLMAAPMVNEVAMILLWGLFGLKVMLTYISFGVGLAIVSGYIIGLLKLEKWVEPFVWELQKSRRNISIDEGMPMGTVLAFTMSVTALSLPEMVILKKVLRPQLLAISIGLMTIGIISIGYIFNALLT